MAWVKLRSGRHAHRRRAPRLLQGQDRDLQDPALLEVRRRVPDDGHGQGPEVQDARAVDRRARPGEGRGDRDRVAGAVRPGPRGPVSPSRASSDSSGGRLKRSRVAGFESSSASSGASHSAGRPRPRWRGMRPPLRRLHLRHRRRLRHRRLRHLLLRHHHPRHCRLRHHPRHRRARREQTTCSPTTSSGRRSGSRPSRWSPWAARISCSGFTNDDDEGGPVRAHAGPLAVHRRSSRPLRDRAVAAFTKTRSSTSVSLVGRVERRDRRPAAWSRDRAGSRRAGTGRRRRRRRPSPRPAPRRRRRRRMRSPRAAGRRSGRRCASPRDRPRR